MNQLEVGMRIVGIRGVFVGLVDEVRDEAFRIAPEADREPFWVDRSAILGIDGRRVELICDASEVHRYRLNGDVV
ncbi:MAG TPA: DUF2171 domain-containing protein [Tepidiformaceae bacterium]|nr:DUF2171 domain-containing protein [Tepidiformaceae bacterium]